jgi:hypothetical protein
MINTIGKKGIGTAFIAINIKSPKRTKKIFEIKYIIIYNKTIKKIN